MERKMEYTTAIIIKLFVAFMYFKISEVQKKKKKLVWRKI